MLTKDLLRVSRVGGGYRPRFAAREHRPLAARVLGTYQGHVGEPREKLDAALKDLETDADHFKLVRGFAKLLEREAVFETQAPADPERARRVAFENAEEIDAVSEDERAEALRRASDGLGVDPADVADSLYADLDERQVLAEFEARWVPDELLAQYNLSLAQTALFDATELRVRTDDPKALVSAIKRLRLMYEIHRGDRESGEADPETGWADERTTSERNADPSDREVVVTGPDALFRSTRRYGTRFARLLRTIAKANEWRFTATIDDRGTERTLSLSADDPVSVPGTEPVATVTFDSGVEADFAARFESLDLDWALTREPEPLETGARVMIPDFAFDYRHADFRVFFEIMGFWTPEYVEKKLSQLETVEDVELLVAVDESLGVGERIEARDHRAIPYSGTVRLKDVRDVLRRYEDELVAQSVADLPDELRPDADVRSLESLAGEYGVSEDAVAGTSFPDHERVGRTLVRPAVLDELAGELDDGMTYSKVEDLLAERDLADASAVLSELGYAVEWTGLSGGTVRRKDANPDN